MLPFNIFFAALVLLTVVDAWTTMRGLRSGASEANPVLRALAKAFGIKEALILLKAAYLYLVWTSPPAQAIEQWIVLGVYAAIAVNNLRILRKLDE